MTLEDFLIEARRLARPSVNTASRKTANPSPATGMASRRARCVFRRARRHMAERVSRRGRRIGPRGNRRATRSVRTPAVPIRRDIAPPIEAVFRFGSAAIDTYLGAHGWQRDWGFNSNFKGTAARLRAGVDGAMPAVHGRGGRRRGRVEHAWPDDDEQVDLDLVLWTFEESEPWIEVFSDGGRYSVIQRITWLPGIRYCFGSFATCRASSSSISMPFLPATR